MSFDRALAESSHVVRDTPTAAAPGRATLTGRIFRRAAADASVSPDATDAVANASSSDARSLPAPLQARFEQSLGVDLSEVRVHTGAASESAASAVGARAYALGNDVHFAAGAYDPGSTDGDLLIAHEVAHTVQQAGATPRPQFQLEVSSPGDATEVEADRAAAAMVSGAPATVSAGPRAVSRNATGPDPKKIAELRAKIAKTQKKLSTSTHWLADGADQAGDEYDDASDQVDAQCELFHKAYEQVEKDLAEAKDSIDAEDEFKHFVVDTTLELVTAGAGEAAKGAEAVAKESSAIVGLTKEVLKAVGMEEAGVIAGDVLGVETLGKEKVGLLGSDATTAEKKGLASLKAIRKAEKALRALTRRAPDLLDASQSIGSLDSKLAGLEKDTSPEAGKTMSQIETALAKLPSIEGMCSKLDLDVATQLSKAQFAASLAKKQTAAATKESFERQIWSEWLGKLDADEWESLKDKSGIVEALERFALSTDFGGLDAKRAEKTIGKTAQSYGGAGPTFLVRVDGVNGKFTAVRAAGGDELEIGGIPAGEYGTVVGVTSTGELIVAPHFVAPDASFVAGDAEDPTPAVSMKDVIAKEKQPDGQPPKSGSSFQFQF